MTTRPKGLLISDPDISQFLLLCSDSSGPAQNIYIGAKRSSADVFPELAYYFAVMSVVPASECERARDSEVGGTDAQYASFVRC